MMTYKRPMFEKHIGGRKASRAVRYPYSVDILKRYDAFELFTLDGGGFFFTQEHLGGKDTNRFLKTLRSGALLAPWTKAARGRKTPQSVDWLAVYDDAKPGGYVNQDVEQHVWLNRLYFLLPIAQEYLRTGRKEWAETWFAYFKHWSDTLYEPARPVNELTPARCYAWRDMQVTWRVLVLIHSVALIAGRGNPFTAEQWSLIYRTIGSHAARVCEEAKKQLPKRPGGKCPYNHFLQKGAALIYVGALYPELDGAKDWLETGRSTVTAYFLRHCYSDGGSVEACPSYSHFIARLFLDAYLLLKDNRQRGIPGLRESIAKQYTFLAETSSPAWRSLQVGDSYSLDVRRDVEIVSKVFPFRAPGRKQSVCFPASQFAVLRKGRVSVYVDAMPGGLWHIHRGKPNAMVYYGQSPVLIESGCVNYDRDDEREGWLKSRGAHNVMVVEPVEKDEWPGTSTFYKLGKLRGGNEFAATCEYRGKGAKYCWTRAIRVKAGGVVEVTDKVTSRKPVRCALHWHLAECRLAQRGAALEARTEAWRLNLRCEGTRGNALRPAVARRLALDDANERYMAPDVAFRQSGRTVLFKTLLRVEDSD